MATLDFLAATLPKLLLMVEPLAQPLIPTEWICSMQCVKTTPNPLNLPEKSSNNSV
tara:strand:+ start:4069 stop:4236 length:168 start_codon:yes stop_codon:yes gene_type:complete